MSEKKTKKPPTENHKDVMQKKMQRYQNNVWYSITINPDEDGQFINKPDRFHRLKQLLCRQFDNFFMGVKDIVLFPDLSFPEYLGKNKYCRIHYHGKILFHDVLLFLMSTTIWRYFTVEIDTIDDPEYWTAYCRKFIDHTNTTESKINMKFFKKRINETTAVKDDTIHQNLRMMIQSMNPKVL